MQTYETFTIDDLPARKMNYGKNWHKAISYEISLGQTLFQRNVHSIALLLSDLGGLAAALFGLN